MKLKFSFIFLSIFSCLVTAYDLLGMQGGRVDGSMMREGMGFHQYHGGYHRSMGGYSYDRAYGAYGRHSGRYSHRGYDRYGSQGYVRKEANPRDNVVVPLTNPAAGRPAVAKSHRDIAADQDRAVTNRARGGRYWGYYSPYYQYGLYPWYNYGDPYFYYQKADYYPWYYGINPGWLWW